MTIAIAWEIFKEAAVNPAHDVSDFAYTSSLKSILSEELKANAVLHKIHASRTFPALSDALTEVKNIFPVYRQDCLMTALRLIPKLGLASAAGDELLSRLRALLPPLAQCHDGAPGPRDTAVLAMVEAFAPMHPYHDGHLGLKNVLGLIGQDAPVSPRLASALVRWLSSHLQNPDPGGMLCSQLREQLLPVAPRALQARLGKMLDFQEKLNTDTDQPLEKRMADQMKAYQAAQAAGDTDLRWQLRLLCRLWRTWGNASRSRYECRDLYGDFFEQLTPAQQIDIVKQCDSPLAPEEITPFLATLVGRIPETTILDALKANELSRLPKDYWQERANLVAVIVQKAAGTPQQLAVLEKAIMGGGTSWPQMVPLLKGHIARADPGQQRRLNLCLEIIKVGCGKASRDLVKTREPMSAEVDKLLKDKGPVDPSLIEALVDLDVGWLTASQKSLLIKRVGELPPERSAHCLVKLFSSYSSALSSRKLPHVKTILEACWKLPPEHRAGPISALFDRLYLRNLQLDARLLRGVRELYDASPTIFRPQCSGRIKRTMLRTPDNTFV